MAVYSNILIFAALVFLAADPMVPKTSRLLGGPASQAGLLEVTRRQALRSVFPSPQEAHPQGEQLKRSGITQTATSSVADPPFLKHPILFEPNSLKPSSASKNMLRRSATWLQQHPESRVLIVGSCDSNGSEACTHALAEGRGAAIEKLLRSSGITANQIAGVKGWDNLDRNCLPYDSKCQQLNRTARIFLAGSVTPQEKP